MTILLKNPIITAAFFLSTTALLPLPSHSAKVEQQVEKPIRQAVNTQQATQKIVDKWKEDRSDLTSRYEQLKEEVAELDIYKDKLQKSVATSQKRLEKKNKQLEETARITSEISPFLEELYNQLEEVTSEGLPFLAGERKERTEKMKEMMADPETSIGEKYRRLMEALRVEAEYGFTTEVYQESIPADNGSTLVNVFRLGRLNLFYLALDNKQCGFYNEATGKWETLPDNYLRSIKSAIAMAKKQQPVNIVNLPLGQLQK